MVKSDADLMLAFQDGDKEAFDALLNRHQVGLYNFFYRLQGRASVAEDLTQEVFFKIFRHAARYEKTAKFTTFLYRVARNVWFDWLRKRKRRGVMASLDRTDAEGDGLYGRLSGGTPEPLEGVLADETAAQIQRAIAALPEEQRLVFVLAEVQGMRYAEVGEALDIPEGTVKSRMHNAVHKLRERLQHLQ
jgi:RNA polymerase sigma-70 factor (ECF subfamily)